MFLPVLVVAGAGLRLFELGAKSFWTDELLSIWHAQHIVDVKTFFTVTGLDAHPPLYFLILKAWALGGEGEFYLRLLSVFFGLLVVLTTYFLGRQFLAKNASLFAAFLTSISPLFLLYDREVRMYSLFTLLSLLSSLFFIKALKENKNINWGIYTFVTILNTYTHYHSFLLISSQWLFFLLMFSKYKNQWKKFLISQVIIAFLFLFWFPAFLFHANQNLGIGKLIRFPITGEFFIKPLYLFFSFSIGQTILPWNYWIVIPAGVLFISLFILGIIALHNQKETTIFILTTLFFPILPALFLSELMPRYMVFLAPLYYLVLAQGVKKITRPVLQISCLLLISFILSYSIKNYYTNKEFHILAHIDPWREVGSYLKENVKMEDIIFNIGGVPVNHYTGFNIPVLGADAVEVLKKEIRGNQFTRVWLVVSNPEYKRQGEEAIRWMNEHYSLILEKRHYRDPDYARKAKLFKKDFLEYRIRVYLYQ